MSQHVLVGTITLDGNAARLSDLIEGSGTDVMLSAKSTNTDDIQLASSEDDLGAEATRYDMEAGESVGIEGFNSVHNLWVDGTSGDKLRYVIRKI